MENGIGFELTCSNPLRYRRMVWEGLIGWNKPDGATFYFQKTEEGYAFLRSYVFPMNRRDWRVEKIELLGIELKGVAAEEFVEAWIRVRGGAWGEE